MLFPLAAYLAFGVNNRAESVFCLKGKSNLIFFSAIKMNVRDVEYRWLNIIPTIKAMSNISRR